mmetsp:Transcript_70532/g.181804  ORF Transcript_70532/g.181804 Transcript_70532/m.181804 type:complete len:228 (+) Transcript_70532:829-1512(+)
MLIAPPPCFSMTSACQPPWWPHLACTSSPCTVMRLPVCALRKMVLPDWMPLGAGVGAGVGPGVGAGVGAGISCIVEHEEPVGTGHAPSKQSPKVAVPSSRVTRNSTAPVRPVSCARHVAPPTRDMTYVLPPTASSAERTALFKFEKTTFVNHALLPSRTATTAPLYAVSHRTGSYEIGKTPVLEPVICSNGSTWQSKVLALPESTICTIASPARPGSVAGLPSYQTR